MKKLLLLVLCLGLMVGLLSMAPNNDVEEEAVKAAVLDYVEGIYEAQPERIARGVDVTLRKYGFGRRDDSPEYYPAREMNYKQLYNLAATWNKDGDRADPATATKEVTVLDMYDKTASAKLLASWGIDYFHLVNEDGKWKIINVVWQSYPPED